MDRHRAAASKRLLGKHANRRDSVRALLGIGVALGVLGMPDADARTKSGKRKKRRKNQNAAPLCTRNGEACKKPSRQCQASHCVQAPFTIEAIWESGVGHDTWLFVPPQDAGTGPSPQIDYDCNPTNSACETHYPFACVNDDATGPGPEITTIYKRLPGTYAYCLVLSLAPAGDLTVVLKDRDGHKVRTWTSPAVTSEVNDFWHVFDFDGETGRVTSVDAPPGPFPLQVTNVCPE